MDKGYIHIEIEAVQVSKKAGNPCGDVVAYERTPSHTTVVLCDGMGHGIKAHIAAQMCVSRLLELLRQGVSVRKAFASMVRTMNATRETDMPYAVFTVARILNDGVTTVLSYEMPPPIFVTSRYANVLQERTVTVEGSLIGEANFHTAPGEGIVIVSDGITQAGLGRGLTHGWTPEGLNQYIKDCISDRIKLRDIPEAVITKARQLWQTGLGDDCTTVIARCRWGHTVNILTGPPKNRLKDQSVARQFMMREGTKVICGGTTSKIVAEHLKKPLLVEENPQSMLAPARFMIEGVDLVTEGAVTLNQVYNVLEEDPTSFDEESGVTELHDLLRTADRVNLVVGGAINPATKDISFRQRGILTRQAILPLIVDKLEKAGKLVVVEHV